MPEPKELDEAREKIANKIKPYMSSMCPPGIITGIIGCPDYALEAQDGLESCKYCVADQILNLKVAGTTIKELIEKEMKQR